MKYQRISIYEILQKYTSKIFIIVALGGMCFLAYNSYRAGTFFEQLPLNLLLMGLIVFVIYIPKFLRLKKQIRTIEMTEDFIKMRNWEDEETKIEIKKIKELNYCEVLSGDSKCGELRIKTEEETTKIRLPELFRDYKKLYLELETKTGLKITKKTDTS